MKNLLTITFLLVTISSFSVLGKNQLIGEDGYRLWLKYDLIKDTQTRREYINKLTNIQVSGSSDTTAIIKNELVNALPSLLGVPINVTNRDNVVFTNNGLIVEKLNPQLISDNKLQNEIVKLGNEGYLIKTVTNSKNNKNILITANTDIGLLYGTYHFLRMLQTSERINTINVTEIPKVNIRMLNHWDNLDRHVERGYAGSSIWNWHKLPDYVEQRYVDYARANASIGINGTAVNNVNADSLILTSEWLKKVQALADVFRPYGIKIYLSIKFSSPQQIGGLSTSDPLAPKVSKWWNQKAKEIYESIPDFGGFLVKANSEGQPGPGDYNRTHAQGANMLAKALQPYGGNVIWRAFVYSNDPEKERSLQAFDEFVPLDGKFENNVVVQVKNGPIDFQPREPFSPIFGVTPKTPLAMEFQITQEYLGFSTHLAYLGTLYEEVLDADTLVNGKGSTVAKIVDGSLSKIKKDKLLSVFAGVANIGSDRNWTGHIFGQANWYAFGRLAWNHQLSASDISESWIKMTLTDNVNAVNKIKKIMMNSREHIVNYMTPLGLHHLMDTGHHYGPGPWVDNLGREDWNPVYYHRADDLGIGIDRTSKGTNAVSQYAKPWRKIFSDPKLTPDNLLLWFHHLPWDYKMRSGDTLWNELVKHYYHGAKSVKQMEQQWLELEKHIDPHQFNQVKMALKIQVKEANWWRDACVLYFQTFSKRPLPEGLKAPKNTLKYYQSLKYPYAPGRG